MYHVRFLKAPSFNFSDGRNPISLKSKKQKTSEKSSVAKSNSSAKFSLSKQIQGHSINFNSVITISNDLGEEFFYGNAKLKTTIQLGLKSQFLKSSAMVVPPILDQSSQLITLTQDTSNWTAGNRSLQVSVPVQVKDLNKCVTKLRASHSFAGKHNKQHSQDDEVFACMKIEVLNPEKIQDELGTQLCQSISQAYESFAEVVSSRPDKSYESSTFQFLNVTSAPFQILTKQDIYEILANGKSTTSTRYCVRTLSTCDVTANTENFNYKSPDISIIEELGNGIERHLWNAGIHTMTILPFLLKNIDHLPTTAPNILELGTGVGIISIALSKIFKDANIFATDLSDAEEICMQNIRLNDSNAIFKNLEWCTDGKSGFVDRGWDLIIITDCTYNPSYYDDLINVIQRESDKETTVLLAHKIREPNGEKKFFQTFGEKFHSVHQVWIHNLHESVHIGQYKKKTIR